MKSKTQQLYTATIFFKFNLDTNQYLCLSKFVFVLFYTTGIKFNEKKYQMTP